MSVRTVVVCNISLRASEQDIKEFFSFSGDIEYIEMRNESERSQQAYVTFKDSQGADTAILLSGAVIVDMPVNIIPVEDYQLPPKAKGNGNGFLPESAVKTAEEMMSSVLAKGLVLGKDALEKAKSLDERHQLLSSATAAVASLDRRIGLTEKITLGTAVVNEKVKEVDQRFQVSEITKSAGAAILSNRHVSTGASWVSAVFGRVAKAADDVVVMTREKLERADEEKKEMIQRQRAGVVADFAHIHLDDGPAFVHVEEHSADGERKMSFSG